MRSAVMAAVLSGCGFHTTATTVDAPPAQDDAATAAPCAVAVASTGVDRGKVGDSTGGTMRTPLVCPPGQLMIGAALLVSDGFAGGPQERSAQGIQLACAPVTIADPPVVGTITTVAAMGDGGANWSPSTWTPMTTCPAGAVIAGMLVHSGQFDAAFIDASLHCAQLDGSAHVVETTDVYIAGSLTEQLHPNGAVCGADEVLAAATPSTGAGLDSLELLCATPACQ